MIYAGHVDERAPKHIHVNISDAVCQGHTQMYMIDESSMGTIISERATTI